MARIIKGQMGGQISWSILFPSFRYFSFVGGVHLFMFIRADIEDVSEMRPAPPGEKSASSTPKSGKDNKKRASKPEDSQDEAAPARKPRRRLIHVDLDLAIQHLEDEENNGEESALVPRTRKPIEAVNASEPDALPLDEGTPNRDSGKSLESPEIEIVPPSSTNTPKGTNTERAETSQSAPSEELGAMTTGRAPEGSGEEKALRLLCGQKEGELKDLRAELAKARKNEAELDEQVNVILTGYGLLGLTSKANTSMSQLQQKLEMIGQLQSEVDQFKADCHRCIKNMDQLAADEKAGLAQAKKIEQLEAELARARAEAEQAKAEVEKTKARTDKTIAVYLKDVAAVQAKLREASDREKQSNDLAK
ncbi:PREDICTED: uncharacterized protein LOC109241628 [Nicotiana attenuata]|uniref:uncharacterized protein LOC109241628 n=1 Tax=Nicotiana attenuata TaxID=49451 RepID=UPI0009055CEF|nr:PREDICTED: uncharacterized protein LOC109241628 [Nicotiana attenuata]